MRTDGRTQRQNPVLSSSNTHPGVPSKAQAVLSNIWLEGLWGRGQEGGGRRAGGGREEEEEEEVEEEEGCI